MLAARRGDRAEATRILQTLEARVSPYQRGVKTYWAAGIAARLGDHGRAVRLLRKALEGGQPVGVRTHNDPDFESLRDDPAFRRLVQPRG